MEDNEDTLEVLHSYKETLEASRSNAWREYDDHDAEMLDKQIQEIQKRITKKLQTIEKDDR